MTNVHSPIEKRQDSVRVESEKKKIILLPKCFKIELQESALKSVNVQPANLQKIEVNFYDKESPYKQQTFKLCENHKVYKPKSSNEEMSDTFTNMRSIYKQLPQTEVKLLEPY